VIRATFELEPPGSAEALVAEVCLGQADGPAFVAGRVVADDGGRATVELPAGNWSPDLTMVLTALAGEVLETARFTRCRLVEVELPADWLPGPGLGAWPGVSVGLIVKPSLGLAPAELADVAARAAAGGARLVKDDELLGDPPWCPLEARVRAVAARLPPDVVYAANVSGSHDGLLDRARRAVDAGATGLMVNVGTQGLDAVRALRSLALGVPLLAHRVGTGGLTRNPGFGLSLAVLAQLTRLAGADLVLCGAFDGKLHDTDDDVAAQLVACRRPLPGRPRSATALLGGGVGPERVRALLSEVTRRLGPPLDGIVLLCGQAAYLPPGGVGGGVAATVRAVQAVVGG
jgi:ribulose-bisphosphate carboxylase large chain